MSNGALLDSCHLGLRRIHLVGRYVGNSGCMYCTLEFLGLLDVTGVDLGALRRFLVGAVDSLK
jgi:hypothetical protein